MSSTNEDHHEYDDLFVAGLEWIWGEGFMSPGGSAEVNAILNSVDLTGKRVIDIGCGIGGIDVVLVKQHGAAHVIGVDVEAPLITRANEMAQGAGVTKQIDFQLIKPGPLPFPDGTFDVVFSKDALIHIPNKRAIYSEMYRVLRPNGRLAFSDWYGSTLPNTPEFIEWLDIVDLSFAMKPIETAVTHLKQIGFKNIQSSDRNAWYAQYMLEELATLHGQNYQQLINTHGKELAAARLQSSSLKKIVVDQGLLRPGHIRAQK